jgi:uncharacterized protein (TIGR02453 family)
MAGKFQGFAPGALTFFRQLGRNNDRAWFTAHKETFQVQVYEPMLALVEELAGAVRSFAADYVPDNPRKALYRIYRDTRFSHDKTPYKTHIAARFEHRRVARNRGGGFYFEVDANHLGIAAGMYMPDPEQLLAVRKAICDQPAAFTKLANDRALLKALGSLQGQKLARVPKGYDVDSPAAEWLKFKQLYYYIELPAKVACTPKVTSEVLMRFKASYPFVQFINEAIMRATGDEEEDRPVRPEPMF